MCTHCSRTGHDISECQKKKKDNESNKNKSSNPSKGSGTGSSGSSGSSSAKANVAATQDDVVHLFRASTESPDVESAFTSHSDLSDKELSNMWLIDSGASRIMCSHRHWFRHFTPLPKPIKVVLGDNSSIPATGTGRILVRMNTGNGYQNAVLQDALYVPDLNGNLLSVSHFTCRGSEIRFAGEGCQLLDQRKNTACVGQLRGNLYIMDIKVSTNESTRLATVPTFPSEGEEAPAFALTARAKPSSADLQTWHRRLGHLNPEAVSRMLSKGMVTGMEITDGSTIATPCEPCIKGKQSRADIHKSTDLRSDTVLGCIFSDVCG